MEIVEYTSELLFHTVVSSILALIATEAVRVFLCSPRKIHPPGQLHDSVLCDLPTDFIP